MIYGNAHTMHHGSFLCTFEVWECIFSAGNTFLITVVKAFKILYLILAVKIVLQYNFETATDQQKTNGPLTRSVSSAAHSYGILQTDSCVQEALLCSLPGHNGLLPFLKPE